MAYRVEYIDIDTLKPHEAVREKKATSFARFAKLTRKRFRMKPIIVDRESMVILDGHHRFTICKELGCKRVPCILVDYLVDPQISVLARKPEIPVSKEAVVAMGISGAVFPAKTTKHVFAMPIPEIWVDLRQCFGEEEKE